MNFNEFLSESVSGQYKKNIGKDDVVNIIKEKCSDFLKNENRPTIYRGSNNGGNCYILNTSYTSRKSAHTNNSYTVVLDKTLTNDYPKRSQSIICSTWDHKASKYGDVNVIFPCNGCKIGDVGKDDIWYAKYYKSFELKNFSGVITEFRDDLNHDIDNINTINDVIDIIKELWQYELDELKCFTPLPYDEDMDDDEIHNQIKDNLEKYISPKNLGFTAYKSSTVKNSKDHELWIGGEMISIPLNLYNELKGDLE